MFITLYLQNVLCKSAINDCNIGCLLLFSQMINRMKLIEPSYPRAMVFAAVRHLSGLCHNMFTKIYLSRLVLSKTEDEN